MAIYSSEYLKGLASRKQRLFESELKLFSAKTVSESTSFDIFLSHSFLDKSEVQGLY